MKVVTPDKSIKCREGKPGFSKKKASQLSITGPALVELLRAVLAKGASFRFQAKGFSMSPFIRDGDIVTLASTAGVGPCLGDIVAFVRLDTERLVIHRVVRKKKHAFSIMGDYSNEPDSLVSNKNILGRVVKVERNGETISFGLGREKILIAFLTRNGLFLRFMLPAWRLISPLVRKSET
jgi:signal peptidase I